MPSRLTGRHGARNFDRSATSRSPGISKRRASNSKTSTRTTTAGANSVEKSTCQRRHRVRKRGRCCVRSDGSCTSTTETARRVQIARRSRGCARRRCAFSDRERRFRADADRLADNIEDVGHRWTRGSRSSGGIRRSAPSCSSFSTSFPSASTTFTRRSASPTFPSQSTPGTRGPRSSQRSISAPASSHRPGSRESGGTQNSRSDLFAFTLDKSAGSFSPTTRYRDYAISPELIHWESQSTTSLDSDTGRRYISQAQAGYERGPVRAAQHRRSAFWCLGPATYVSHQGERPIAFTWRLHHRLPGDLFAEFAAAVA